MHELSIAHSIVEIAKQQLTSPTERVRSIRLRIGSLSCVHRDSLYFSFDLITADTPLAGAKLLIEELPIVVFCPTCDALQELPGIQRFACPTCGTPTADIRQGRELDVESIEVFDEGHAPSVPSSHIVTAEAPTRTTP